MTQQNTRNKDKKIETMREVGDACDYRNRIVLYQESGGQGVRLVAKFLYPLFSQLSNEGLD